MNSADTTVYEKLIGIALRFVSYRPRSRREIETYLSTYCTKRHISAPGEIVRVMDRLTELGYADDGAFVRWWITQRTGRKPKGDRQIVSELLAKGIKKEVIDGALSAFAREEPDRNERTRALTAATAKLRTLSSYPSQKRKEKLSAYLSRRGFDWEVISSVVDEIASD